ncbi:hypothetical protein [Microbaculum marinum]|uniref:Uncharacterized protein n=1 Tax=Microbaculum marinum TaxID=1764581 RepID=A0AAW9RMI9_9HYPH
MIDNMPQTPIDTSGNAARGTYAHPRDVVGDPALSNVEKRQILNEWAEAARAENRASGKGESDVADDDLEAIEQALQML